MFHMSEFDAFFHDDGGGDDATRAARDLMWMWDGQFQLMPLSFVIVLIWYRVAQMVQELWPPRAPALPANTLKDLTCR
jgi:hypothetical protein